MMSKTKLAMDDNVLYYDDSDYYYYNQYDQYYSTPKSKCNSDSKLADENIKYCTKCNTCYEQTILRNYVAKNRVVIFYQDFPSYGKEKKDCLKCDGSNYKKSMYGNTICYESITKKVKT